MIINKTSKNYNQISVNEVKEDLAIALTDNTYDSQLRRFIKSAITEAEAFVDDDLVLTSNVKEESSHITPFTFCYYDIGSVNTTISAITVTYNNVITILSASTYFIEKNNNFTRIKFLNPITGNVLKIYYQSGFSTLPETVKRAISVRCGDYLDMERNNYMPNTMIRSKAFERLLSPLKIIVY
jgi:hypothetical protein